MEPGERVAGRYVIQRELGRGGMGVVFLARDEKFRELVALKVAAATGALHDEFRERFLREARVGNRLGRREGFVRAIDWGEVDAKTLYLALDYVEGAAPLDLRTGSLEARLARFREAARLVERAHAEGVVHRDLKPANFLRGSDGRLRLTDFGLAKMSGEDEPEVDAGATGGVTRTGSMLGTPLYMAPEQFEDAKAADARADVYSLGVLLFEALTAGSLPFMGRSPTEIARKQDRVRDGRDPMPRPGTLAPALASRFDEVCVRALALDPERRLASVAGLLAELGPEPDSLVGASPALASTAAWSPPAASVACPRCARSGPAAARYCAECGASLAPPSPRGGRLTIGLQGAAALAYAVALLSGSWQSALLGFAVYLALEPFAALRIGRELLRGRPHLRWPAVLVLAALVVAATALLVLLSRATGLTWSRDLEAGAAVVLALAMLLGLPALGVLAKRVASRS